MPYISAKDDRREKLRKGEPALLAGELNYQIFYYIKHHYTEQLSVNGCVGLEIIKETVREFVDNFLGEKPNYQRWNDMTGVLIRCGFEVKRRLNIDTEFLLDIMKSYNARIDAYEDLKIQENSDVE